MGTRKSKFHTPHSTFGSGAGDGDRTRDLQHGKLMLCQLSYSRFSFCTVALCRTRTPVPGGAAPSPPGEERGEGRGAIGGEVSEIGDGPLLSFLISFDEHLRVEPLHWYGRSALASRSFLLAHRHRESMTASRHCCLPAPKAARPSLRTPHQIDAVFAEGAQNAKHRPEAVVRPRCVH